MGFLFIGVGGASNSHPFSHPDGRPKTVHTYGQKVVMFIVPKNWRDFQHYKDRNPPWIRLHKSLLDNYNFQCLPVASRALAPMLWLLASDSIDGKIDATPKRLAFRLRMTEREVIDALKPLIDNEFFLAEQDAIDVLAECLHDAVPETEALQRQRTEADTETKPRKARSAADASVSVSDLIGEGVDEQHAKDWMRVRKDKGAKTLTLTAWKTVKTEADAAGMTPAQAVKMSAENSWQGFKASWVSGRNRPQQNQSDTTAEAMRLLGFHNDEVIDA